MRLLLVILASLKLAMPASADACDPSLWNHTYNHSRFTVIALCKSFTGIVEAKRNEADGDVHIHLRLDQGQGKPLNHANMIRQNGCLVVEPVCIGTVRQRDAIQPCRGAPKVKVPKVGTHVRVFGVYLIDNSPSHNWVEIHAAQFEVLP